MQSELKLIFLFLVLSTFSYSASNPTKYTADVLIVGGGASGVAAGIQSARMGVKTLIVEELPWLGGMLTAAGVSAIDGNMKLPGGIWGEFKEALATHYGGDSLLKTGWVSDVLFEPSVGNMILQRMAADEKNLQIRFNASVHKIDKEGTGWKVTIQSAGKKETIRVRYMIDATELGDVAKACGVKYDIGMDARSETGESIAPEKSNNIIQDLTYVAVLKDYGKDMTIARPHGYDSSLFACSCDNILCNKAPGQFLWSKHKMLTYGQLPNKKYMINWPIAGNDYYLNLIEKTPGQRTEELKKAKNFTLCYLYFMQTRLGFNTLYLADDEFPTADRFPFIPYHRESRRIEGAVRFTVNDITHPYDQKTSLYRTCIAVGDYPVDHHHGRFSGTDSLPDLHFYPIPSYGLPLGTLLPKQVQGLIVAEKSISVSNLVNGSTRLQPVVLQIGQAAGALAALSVIQGKQPREVAVRDVQSALLDAGSYLLPYLDVPCESPLFKPLQRIGSTGILKGIGRNVGWSNQTLFRADTVLLTGELTGLTDFYTYVQLHGNAGDTVTLKEALRLITLIAETEKIENPYGIPAKAQELFVRYGFEKFNPERPVLRGEMAVLLDELLHPFTAKNVDISGKFIP